MVRQRRKEQAAGSPSSRPVYLAEKFYASSGFAQNPWEISHLLGSALFFGAAFIAVSLLLFNSSLWYGWAGGGELNSESRQDRAEHSELLRLWFAENVCVSNNYARIFCHWRKDDLSGFVNLRILEENIVPRRVLSVGSQEVRYPALDTPIFGENAHLGYSKRELGRVNDVKEECACKHRQIHILQAFQTSSFPNLLHWTRDSSWKLDALSRAASAALFVAMADFRFALVCTLKVFRFFRPDTPRPNSGPSQHPIRPNWRPEPLSPPLRLTVGFGCVVGGTELLLSDNSRFRRRSWERVGGGRLWFWDGWCC